MVLYRQLYKRQATANNNMFKISKLADYATIILSLLARVYGVKYSATGVADETGIPLPTVSKVLKLLNEAGLVVSKRGVNGGYQASRAAADINLKEIITAIDGKPAITECTYDNQNCACQLSCGMKSNWEVVNQRLLRVLADLSLADMDSGLDTDHGRAVEK